MALDRLRHHVLRKRAGTGDGTIQVIDHFVEDVEKIPAGDRRFLQRDAFLPGQVAGIRALVVARALVEAAVESHELARTRCPVQRRAKAATALESIPPLK